MVIFFNVCDTGTVFRLTFPSLVMLNEPGNSGQIFKPANSTETLQFSCFVRGKLKTVKTWPSNVAKTRFRKITLGYMSPGMALSALNESNK